MMRATALLGAALVLAGCSAEDAGVFGNAILDELRGAPDAQALVASTPFHEDGIAFDYPAVLRRREGREDDGSGTWTLERGMFTLELYAPRYEVTSESYLGSFAQMLGGGAVIDAEAPTRGRAASLCGHEITSTVVRLKILGDWSQIEGFDLPAPPGESRLLLFDDEPVKGQPSDVAAATRARVLASLRCDAAFVLRSVD